MKNKIKHIFSIVVFALISVTSYSSVLFDTANQLYIDGKYFEALEKYETLIKENKTSENLYYNIANSYFKTEQIGKSILYYEKALKINPNNTDAQHNLKLANIKIENKLEIPPKIFFISWWKKLIYFFSTNTWAWIAICFSWFSVIAFAFYLFSKNNLFKKTAFLKSFIFGFISIFGILIAGISSEKIFSKKEIVLIGKTSYGKDAPSDKATKQELFTEGIKLKVKDEVGGFYKVLTSEGNTVWVKKIDFLEI